MQNAISYARLDAGVDPAFNLDSPATAERIRMACEDRFTKLGWKFMSRSHCQELGQQASWLLIGCTRVDNQSEAIIAS